MEIWDVYDAAGQKTGKLSERNAALGAGQYHLVVFLWIRNSRGEFLLSRRSAGKTYAHCWETPGGAALQGEGSQTAVMREAGEEIGLKIRPHELKKLDRTFYEHKFRSFIADVWLLNRDIEEKTLVLQPEEVEAVRWCKRDNVKQMIENQKFSGWNIHQPLFQKGLL